MQFKLKNQSLLCMSSVITMKKNSSKKLCTNWESNSMKLRGIICKLGKSMMICAFKLMRRPNLLNLIEAEVDLPLHDHLWISLTITIIICTHMTTKVCADRKYKLGHETNRQTEILSMYIRMYLRILEMGTMIGWLFKGKFNKLSRKMKI